MTIIAAAEDSTSYWIASDSHGVTETTSFELGSKLIDKTKYVVGFSNSYRVADIIRENTNFPKSIGSIKGVRKFRDVLKEHMLEDGCSLMGIGDDTLVHPVSIIMIAHTGIYSIDVDYQIHQHEGYIAIGSGTDIALGALRAMLKATSNAEQAVTAAVEAAIFHCNTCGGNIHYMHILKKK